MYPFTTEIHEQVGGKNGCYGTSAIEVVSEIRRRL